jgi:hypothetical protein
MTRVRSSTFSRASIGIFLEGQEFWCPKGSVVFIPAGRVHGFRVGDVPSRKLNIYSPAAMVGYFDELGRAAATSPSLDDVTLVAMAVRYSMRVVGAVPDGYT